MSPGGLEHGFYDFPYLGNVIIPTDTMIYIYIFVFRGVGQPPTSSNTSNIFQCIQAKLEIDLALAKMFGFSQAPSRVPPC